MVKVKTKSARKTVRKTTSCKEPSQCPHEHYRYDVPDRRGLARDKHTNILATPKGYRWEDVSKDSGDGEKPAKKITSRIRRCPDKYVKKPEKAYIHNFLAEVWSFLTPEMAERLKNMLMNEFSMSSKDAEEFIFKQREANVVNSSTVSLYKKPRDIGDGKVVLDSVIKMRTPNKTYCDKFPKSNIGIRNSWIKDFSDLISDKMADYVLDTMTAERTERQQEIASNLLNKFNTLLEQKASLANPKTQTHKTMVVVADRLSLWLDKNVPMSKENAQRLKDVEEAQEKKKLEDEKIKHIEEERKRTEERAEKERLEAEGEGDQGPGGPAAPGDQLGEAGVKPGEAELQPGEPGTQPGEPGTQPGEPGAQPGEPGAQPGEPGAQPREPGAQPGEPGAQPGEPGAQPGEPGVRPGEPEAQPGEPGAQPGEPGAQPGEPGSQLTQPEHAAPDGAPEDGGIRPAPGEEPPVGADGTQLEDGTKPPSPAQADDLQTGKEEAGAQPQGASDEPASPDAQPGGTETTGEPGIQSGGAEAQPAQLDIAPGASEDGGIKPAPGEGPPAGADTTKLEDGTKPSSPGKEPAKGEEDGGRAAPEKLYDTLPGSAEQREELKETENKDQEPPNEEKPVELEQLTGKGEEGPQPDISPAAAAVQPGAVNETQPETNQQRLSDESKRDKDKYEEPTSEAYETPVPPPGEVQLTPSEIQEKADAEAKAAEKAEAGDQDSPLPIDAGKRPIPDELTTSGVPGETKGVSGESDKAISGTGDEKVGEFPGEEVGSASKDGVLADDKRGEPQIGEKGEPSTQPGQEPTSPGGAKELTPEQKRQQELIQSVTSKILETPAEDTPRQEAIKDVLGKQLEKELGDGEKAAIDQVASKVGTWIDKIVDQVETEYGDRSRRISSGIPSVPVHGVSPVSQKAKGSIFVVKKVDDRRGYDVDLISNTRAHEKIRMARGKSPVRGEVPNPDAALEPSDLKNWARWASDVSDMAQCWAEWIEDTIQEAQKRGELMQTDDSPERLREWDEFRGEKSQGAQHWRKTKKEVEQTANLWAQKGVKSREMRKPQT